MMLMEPASNVSVPSTVVIRILSKVADNVFDPAEIPTRFDWYIDDEATHELELSRAKVNIPL